MDYFAGLMTFQDDDFKIGQKCPRDRKPLISGICGIILIIKISDETYLFKPRKKSESGQLCPFQHYRIDHQRSVQKYKRVSKYAFFFKISI